MFSRRGYYEAHDRPPSPRAVADAALTETIRDIHTMSRGSYGAPRVQGTSCASAGACAAAANGSRG